MVVERFHDWGIGMTSEVLNGHHNGHFNLEERTHKGLSKVSRYKWKSNDDKGEFSWVHKTALSVDFAYQRDATHSKVLEIAKDWSWMGCGVILVVRRPDGLLYVIDGQHRVSAAMKRDDISMLPCMIFDVSEVCDEAKGFLNANTLRKPVPAVAKFRAMVVSGDRRAADVQEVLDELGMVIGKNASARVFGSIAWAVKAAGQDVASFRKTMFAAKDLCGDSGAMAEHLCRGLFALQRRHGALDNAKFVKRMMAVGYEAIVNDIHAASLYFKEGGDRVWMTGIINAVNRGLRNRFYDDSPAS
jgi:hypothetical protein